MLVKPLSSESQGLPTILAGGNANVDYSFFGRRKLRLTWHLQGSIEWETRGQLEL